MKAYGGGTGLEQEAASNCLNCVGGGQDEQHRYGTGIFIVAILNVHDSLIFYLIYACILSMTTILLPVIPDRLDK